MIVKVIDQEGRWHISVIDTSRGKDEFYKDLFNLLGQYGYKGGNMTCEDAAFEGYKLILDGKVIGEVRAQTSNWDPWKKPDYFIDYDWDV